MLSEWIHPCLEGCRCEGQAGGIAVMKSGPGEVGKKEEWALLLLTLYCHLLVRRANCNDLQTILLFKKLRRLWSCFELYDLDRRKSPLFYYQETCMCMQEYRRNLLGPKFNLIKTDVPDVTGSRGTAGWSINTCENQSNLINSREVGSVRGNSVQSQRALDSTTLWRFFIFLADLCGTDVRSSREDLGRAVLWGGTCHSGWCKAEKSWRPDCRHTHTLAAAWRWKRPQVFFKKQTAKCRNCIDRFIFYFSCNPFKNNHMTD